MAHGVLNCLLRLVYGFSICGILCYSFLYAYGHPFRVFVVDTHMVVDCEHYGSMGIPCGSIYLDHATCRNKVMIGHNSSCLLHVHCFSFVR